MAEELDRFQKGEAIHARPLGVIGKGWRWCHRKPVVAGMAVGLILIAAIGIGGILSQWRRAEKALVRERNLADLRLRERYAADMAVVQPAIRQGNIPLARSLLMQYQPQTEQEDLRGVEWHLYDRMTTGEQVRTLTGSGDCRFLVISKDGAPGRRPTTARPR